MSEADREGEVMSYFSIFRDLAWVEQQAYGSPLEKLMMFRLVNPKEYDHSEAGFSRFTYKAMAEYCCASVDQCRDALYDLHRRGLLEIIRSDKADFEISAFWGAYRPEQTTLAQLREWVESPCGALSGMQDGCCWYCGGSLFEGPTPHLEHQIPKSRGGDDIACNLVAACQSCNFDKHTKTVSEYRAHVIQRDGKPKTYKFYGERR